MNVRIDYYTGTGGSQRVSEHIVNFLRDAGCTVTLKRIERDKFIPMEDAIDYYLLVFAVHSFCAPRPVGEWIAQLDGKGRTCALISVSGGGNILTNTACRHKTISQLTRQNFDVIFDEMVRMPNNWMSVPSEKKSVRILRKMPSKANEIGKAVLSGKRKRKFVFWIDYPISALGEKEHNYVEKFGQGIRVTGNCNGCGWCAQRCCSSNITMIDGKAVIGDRCDMCLGCIYGCPQQALRATRGAFQIDKKGYNLREILRKIE